MSSILDRLREPSSMGGIGLLVTGVQTIIAGQYTYGIGQILAGLAAILMAERKAL